MAELLERGELDLTAISTISGVLTEENHVEILAWIRGRSRREVEAFAARHQPGRPVRDQVREIFVLRPAETIPTSTGDAAMTEPSSSPAGNKNNLIPAVDTPDSGKKCQADLTFTPTGGSGNGADPSEEKHPEHVTIDRKFELKFALDPGIMEKLNKARSILSRKHPEGLDLQTILDVLLSEYLGRHDPEERKKRREAHKKKPGAGNKLKSNNFSRTSGECARGTGKHTGNRRMKPEHAGSTRERGKSRCKKPVHEKRTRHIPRAIRDQVFKRDGGRCTFISKDGKRCNSNWNVQVDHIIPFARDGDNSPENLRLLCAKHNQLEAERAYGKKHMKKYRRRE